jgi:hypothetical protein
MVANAGGTVKPAMAREMILQEGIAIPKPRNYPIGDENDWENMEDFKQRLIHWIGQMMFVSGETAEPSPETTWMIEEIVREQVVEMVRSIQSPSRLRS